MDRCHLVGRHLERRHLVGWHLERGDVERDLEWRGLERDLERRHLELRDVECIMNGFIRDNFETETRLMAYPDALAQGAVAVFDEKYGDEVRVVRFGDVSMELCGGTHIAQTGDVASFVERHPLAAPGIARLLPP